MIRLDKYLVSRYSQFSRNKINNFISLGYVLVNNKPITKSSYLIKENDEVVLVVDENSLWVSRGAYKLKKALEIFKINLYNKTCLDIGCSTGGFCQVMIKNGAKKIYAVDVGVGQFSKKLLNEKIILKEKTNFCLTKTTDYDKIDFISCDVSFTSVTKIINHVARIFNYPYIFICLIKPQFELTKKILCSCNGCVHKKYFQQVFDKIYNCARKNNLIYSKIIPSPILGAKRNNQEFFICMEHK